MSDYKPHLDEAADQVKNPQPHAPSDQQDGSSLMEKVSHNIPIIGTMLGSSNEAEQKNSNNKHHQATAAPSGPPDRPEHDKQIEEFLKAQHHSRKVVGDDQGPVGTS